MKMLLEWSTLLANVLTIVTGFMAVLSAFPALRRIATATERSAVANERAAAAVNGSPEVLLDMLYGHDATVAQLERDGRGGGDPILAGLATSLAGRPDVLAMVDLEKLKSRGVSALVRRLRG